MFLYLVIACDSGSNQKNNSATETADSVTISLPKTNVDFPQLSADAQNIITSWLYFQEFENDLKRINSGNVRNYQTETKRMVSVSDSLLRNIPEPLNTKPISSRMRVVNVRVKLLDETMHQPNVTTQVISKNLEETNTAFSNLIIQINETFEKQRIDEMTRFDQNSDQKDSPNND
ncbi:hypothetical protein [uncultured Planktosalinus sp.]|uniref:hypothetical protein n=1 Tax=uncultured Planktosalinus sp. TaxID=1810935 RepID=UPI0030D813AA